MTNQNKQKSLSEVFQELQRDKNKQVQIYKNNQKAKQEASFLFHVKHRTKKDNIILVIIVLIVLFTFSLFSRNYIFAVNVDDGPRNAIGTFEKNENPVDVYAILAENMSNTEQKEILDIEEEIGYETQYISNKDMPYGEIKTIQEGFSGKKIVTYVRSFENNEMIEQTSIGERVLQEAQKQILEIGTSKVLEQYNIHIGDKLYVSEDTDLKKTVNIYSDRWLIIPRYYDVTTLEIINETWVKVSYNDKNTGYILTDYLTSEALTPGITELSRRTKIFNKVDFNMALNEPSGLSLEDYRTMLSYQPQDTNNVFKDNYRMFYDAEQKYGINGVFLASIAIHESAWGRSAIAVNKHNLYGFGAYDASPYESALTFDSYAEGTDVVAAWLISNYLNPAGTVLKTGEIATGRYYNGANVTGVNVRYASDTAWCTKVFATMQSLYAGLQL
ncbi:MAG: glucosaminidase domain-containing protein [Clostridia bacterium]|nr:glucosaminidase domain-containing protein [Clostridia bacterium]